MIKLNNKNITYVALADSNNSLKAPKEIWYADTNNSVKLVYRRKDALIEGEDYEKYHWLQGRNGAYIDTLHQLTTYDDAFYIKAHFDGTIRNPDGKEQDLFGYMDSQEQSVVYAYIDGNGKYNAAYKKSYAALSNINIFTTNIESYISANGSDYTKTLNGTPYTYSNEDLPQGTYGNVYLFVRNSSLQQYFHGDIASFRISDPTFTTDKLHLIPCKLLKPVPKWLDANGIRRQVGECGMIDLVSGKFYGNVNSVGTFTVENYYERKEWLVGDGNANIDGTLICTDYLEWKLAQYSGQYVALNYGELSDNSHQFQLSVNSNATNAIGVFFNDTHNYVSLSQQSVNDIKFLVNSQIIGIINNVNIENNNSNLKFNGKISLNLIAKSGGISKITVDNKERYIPCTITMDLPASMDANNIARTKGTSGMWDLVSDRFYGNVANSGTFKAVNLAEGVDYEAHQWLVGDGMAYINTKVKLHFATDSVYIKGRNNGVPTNDARYFGNYSGRQNAKSLELIYNKYVQNDTVNKQSAYDGRFRINPNSEFEFYTTPFSSTTSVTTIYDNIDTIFNVNLDDSYLNYEASNDLILLNTNDTRYCMKADVANFKVMRSSTIIRNLIPCKLLKSIPAKYDANGIARNAGECGMYDTVNDVFYGNVASSGSFTVSDDN